MRSIVGITLVLWGLGSWSCQWEGPSPVGAREPRWVRTVDGWERADQWQLTVVRRPTLDPRVVAMGQGLLSVLALVAFPAAVRGRSD